VPAAQYALWIAWLVWCICWYAAGAWSAATVQRPRTRQELPYRILTVCGIILLFALYPHPRELELPLWRMGPALAWALDAVALVGFAFTWWARLHLGRLWSPNVTRKTNHHVIDTGPYALVRHPIYTGVIAATLATAAQRGTALALLGAALMALGWYVKARLEERFLREQLGRENYDAYARRVPMLVPLPPRPRA
jgi:protein-S-isoprenylcysteine O-methyltransferase Ste14